MTIDLGAPDKTEALNRRLMTWLLRLSALVLFAVGIGYWIRLVGIYEGPLWRFDLMPFWWKVAAPSLAVLYPVAGVGLWMLTSWGIVIWLLIAIVEAVMHLAFARLFGGLPPWFTFHAVGLALFLGLWIAAQVEARRRIRAA